MLTMDDRKEILELSNHKLKHLTMNELAAIAPKAWHYQKNTVYTFMAGNTSHDESRLCCSMGDLVEFAYGKGAWTFLQSCYDDYDKTEAVCL